MDLKLTIIILFVVGLIALLFAMVYSNSKQKIAEKKDTTEEFNIEKYNLGRF